MTPHPSNRSLLSSLPRHESGLALARLVAAGMVAHMTWEIVARVFAPIWLGGPQEPQDVIMALPYYWFGVDIGYTPATAIHFLTGILFYPLGYRIVATRIVTFGPVGDALLVGVGTWVLAVGFFVGLAGFPPFLEWSATTWISLVGHVLYGFALVWADGRFGAEAPFRSLARA